ncbi:fungal-specific transcription factor domain-containing protein [Spinellus fusiger]|nr:fungal-specific transcription factor domain-containing protein [Spinellus fusiger]
METLLVGLAESGSISSESIQQMLKDPDNGESQEDSDESEGSMHVAHPIPEKKRLSNTPHQDQWQQKKSKTVITTSTSAIAVEPTNTTDSIESIESPGSVHSIDSGELHSFEKGFCDPQYPPKQNMTHYKEDGKRAGNMFSYMGSSSGVYLLSRLFSKKKALAIEIEKRIRPLEKHQDDSMVSTMDHEKYTKTRYLLSENYALSGQTRWELPPRPVMDLLIQVYFTHFNPYMPIIEEEEFRAMYERNKDPFLNSLLAVIGRSSARIMDDSHPIMKQHSISCLGLFDSLTDQIKTNIRLDFSAPKIEMIQVLMIGVCNMEGWVSESLSWLSIGLAVKMAQELGLHRSKPQWGIPKKTAEAHKRIWWIMYTIDQWICAALGRPMIVSDADCDVEFPEIDDLSDNPALHYHLILIHTIKLSGILGDVLRTLCSPRARFINAKEERMAQVSENLMKVLREWEQSLPSSLRLSQEETESISRKTISRELLYKVNSGAGQLFIVFCSVILQTLCPFFNVLPDNTYEEMPSACFYYIQSAVDVIELIDVRSLMYFGWAITSFGLAQVYTFVLFSKQSTHGPPPDIVKKQEAVMKKIYTSLEKHITQVWQTELLYLLTLFSFIFFSLPFFQCLKRLTQY